MFTKKMMIYNFEQKLFFLYTYSYFSQTIHMIFWLPSEQSQLKMKNKEKSSKSFGLLSPSIFKKEDLTSQDVSTVMDELEDYLEKYMPTKSLRKQWIKDVQRGMDQCKQSDLQLTLLNYQIVQRVLLEFLKKNARCVYQSSEITEILSFSLHQIWAAKESQNQIDQKYKGLLKSTKPVMKSESVRKFKESQTVVRNRTNIIQEYKNNYQKQTNYRDSITMRQRERFNEQQCLIKSKVSQNDNANEIIREMMVKCMNKSKKAQMQSESKDQIIDQLKKSIDKYSQNQTLLRGKVAKLENDVNGLEKQLKEKIKVIEWNNHQPAEFVKKHKNQKLTDNERQECRRVMRDYSQLLSLYRKDKEQMANNKFQQSKETSTLRQNLQTATIRLQIQKKHIQDLLVENQQLSKNKLEKEQMRIQLDLTLNEKKSIIEHKEKQVEKLKRQREDAYRQLQQKMQEIERLQTMMLSLRSQKESLEWKLKNQNIVNEHLKQQVSHLKWELSRMEKNVEEACEVLARR